MIPNGKQKEDDQLNKLTGLLNQISTLKSSNLHSPVLNKAQHDLQSHIGRYKFSPNKVTDKNNKITEKKRTTSVPPKLKNEDGNYLGK